MGKGIEFLKEAKMYFLATCDNGQPQLRPFGSNMEYKGRFYFSMGRQKNVFKQIRANPKISISAIKSNNDWIRITGEAVLDEDEEIRAILFEQAPMIKEIYKDRLPEAAFFCLTKESCEIIEGGKEAVKVEL